LKIYTNINKREATVIDANETYPVITTISINIIKSTNTDLKDKIIKTPKLVATALPPLNFKNIE
jgi:hypothetical protein